WTNRPGPPTAGLAAKSRQRSARSRPLHLIFAGRFAVGRGAILDHRNCVSAAEPAMEVDFGAAFGAEGAVAVGRRLSADRAFRFPPRRCAVLSRMVLSGHPLSSSKSMRVA